MENFDGFIGAIAVSGLRAGLDKDTTINLVVSLKRIPSASLIKTLNSLKASEDIGRVAAGVLRVSANIEVHRAKQENSPADQNFYSNMKSICTKS
jgi:hypothetical protein